MTWIGSKRRLKKPKKRNQARIRKLTQRWRSGKLLRRPLRRQYSMEMNFMVEAELPRAQARSLQSPKVALQLLLVKQRLIKNQVFPNLPQAHQLETCPREGGSHLTGLAIWIATLSVVTAKVYHQVRTVRARSASGAWLAHKLAVALGNKC